METRAAILLVDDRPDKLLALEAVLEPLGEPLVRATSGDEALRRLLHEDFAVILLDVNMPGLDGFETAALIRQRRSSETTPIIFVSALDAAGNHLARGYSLGAVDFITSPVVPEILRAKVAVFVDLFRKTELVKRQGEARARLAHEQAARAVAEDAQKRYARLYAEAREARESAEAANQAKDRFLAMLSHELRTPLTPVLSTVQLLEEEPALPAEVRSSLELIRRNVELEARIIDDLLDLTRISKGKVRLRLEDVDAHRLVQSSIDICRQEIAEKQLDVATDFAAEPGLRADAARLQQVFWNLIKNAVKFTPAGGRIWLRTANPAPGRLLVEVQDTGAGIPPEAIGKIFDAFEQGGHAGEGGLGLGLAISRAIVELHHGEISVESAGPGQGATFRVELPAAVSARGVPPAEDSAPAMDPARPARVLLVDDHPDTLRSMERLLRRRGYLVITATDVASALAEAERQPFDVLVSDIGLPDGTGIDLIRRLRQARGQGEEVPGIALSGYGMEEDVARSHEAGFREHLTKPVNVQAFEAVLRRVVAQRGTRQTVTPSES